MVLYWSHAAVRGGEDGTEARLRALLWPGSASWGLQRPRFQVRCCPAKPLVLMTIVSFTRGGPTVLSENSPLGPGLAATGGELGDFRAKHVGVGAKEGDEGLEETDTS